LVLRLGNWMKTEDGGNYVRPAERIAVFECVGTLKGFARCLQCETRVAPA
jgi:hypothetical protein